MNKRKKVSIFYFLEQSIKGLWRNGVMSFTSIAVLMSCLVVLGSFVLLLHNLNYNINNIGVLNYILVFVDTNRDPVLEDTMSALGNVSDTSASADTAVSGDATGSQTAVNDISKVKVHGIWDDLDDTALAELASEYSSADPLTLLSEVEAQVSPIRNFTDLQKARTEIDVLRKKLAAVKLRSGEFDGDTVGRYSTVEEQLDGEYKRITALVDIEMEIYKLENVESVSFTSKAQALAEMNEEYSEYTDLFDRLKDGDNPLTDQFTITYKENKDISNLRYDLEHLSGLIYRVNCREDIANTIESVRSGVVFIFVWFLVILLVVSMFIIINTIKLAVFSRRQEIAVMRYVGATNSFIATPFVFEGVLIGVIASIVAYIVQYYAYMYIHKVVMADFGFISVIEFGDVGVLVALGFAALGILTGIIGSVISLRKYLKA